VTRASDSLWRQFLVGEARSLMARVYVALRFLLDVAFMPGGGEVDSAPVGPNEKMQLSLEHHLV
jgi:hypothetical protein